jgi:hypothetical protein
MRVPNHGNYFYALFHSISHRVIVLQDRMIIAFIICDHVGVAHRWRTECLTPASDLFATNYVAENVRLWYTDFRSAMIF